MRMLKRKRGGEKKRTKSKGKRVEGREDRERKDDEE